MKEIMIKSPELLSDEELNRRILDFYYKRNMEDLRIEREQKLKQLLDD